MNVFKRNALLVGALFTMAALISVVGCGDDDDNNPMVTDEFVFATDAPGAYDRVDRMGMPAIATAVISSGMKDDYNAADPSDDAGGQFVVDITANVQALHTALDDDLVGAGLVPCATVACVGQAAPLVVPDVITINSAQAAGFPNGRRLTDQVIDVTLALVLLDLSASGQSATTLAARPLNPAANDKSFSSTFPYLAAPNMP